MNTADARLKALFADDVPASNDVAFSLSVMERVMRRRFAEDMSLLAGAGLIAGGLFVVLWPMVQPAIAVLLRGLAPAVSILALLVCAGMILTGRAGAALGLET